MTVQPLGGKVSTGQTSEQHKEELERFQTYKNALNKLGADYSPEGRKKRRALTVFYTPAAAQTFRELGLDF